MKNNSWIIDGVIAIINHYNSHNAKIWNVDTDFHKTIGRLCDNLRKLKNPNDGSIKKLLIKKENERNKKNNHVYTMWIDDVNITPKDKCSPGASSTIRQYLQLFIILGLIDDIEVSEYIPRKNDVQMCSIDLKPNFLDILNYENKTITSLLVGEILTQSLYNTFYFYINYGFSLFLFILLNSKLDIEENEKIKNLPITRIRTSKKDLNSLKINNFENYFEYIKKECSNSYENISNILLENYGFEWILNEMLKKIGWDPLDSTLYEKDESWMKIKNLEYKIGQYRSELRTNLMNSRTNGNIYYTDIEIFNNITNQWEPLEWPSYNVEAAHIKAVHSIKKEKKNEIRNGDVEISELDFDLLSNPNNGLLLPNHYHKSFDLDIFHFDVDGNANIRKEFKNDLKTMKIGKFRIKKDVLNDEMKCIIKDLNLRKQI